MALGSDAHHVGDIGAGLDEAAQLARTCGIERLALFQGRRVQRIPLVG
jgi:hypothetical protein